MAELSSIATPARNNVVGGANLLASLLLFAGMDAMVKWLTGSFPVSQILFFRSLFALIPCLVAATQWGGLATLKTARPGAHFTRGLIGIVSMGLIFYAFSVMKLADASAILFAGPLFLTALAGPLLGEHVGPRRWTAVVVGFAGVLIMVQPSGAGLELGAAAALSAAVLYAFAMVMVRRLGTTESAIAITFYFSLFGTVGGGAVLAIQGWVAPTQGEFALLAAVGIIGGTAQIFMSQAFRLAQVAVISPLKYTSLFWVTLFGYLLWGQLPATHVVVGVSIVILSGLYILHRETRLAIAERRRVEVLR